MSKKDPCFLFYSKDWLEGTAEMSAEEKGVYIDLLCYQHQRGFIPSDTIKLARLVRLSDKQFSDIWKNLSLKFHQVVDHMNNQVVDRLVNHKLIEVTTERAEKAIKNRVVGIFAGLLRQYDLTNKQISEIKKKFKSEEFVSFSQEEVTMRITEWFTKWLPKEVAQTPPPLEDANANEDANKILPLFNTFKFEGYDNVKELALRLAKKIDESFPKVMLLKQPFTPEQICKMVQDYDPKMIIDILIGMQNWKPLLKNSESAYLTFVAWERREAKKSA